MREPQFSNLQLHSPQSRKFLRQVVVVAVAVAAAAAVVVVVVAISTVTYFQQFAIKVRRLLY